MTDLSFTVPAGAFRVALVRVQAVVPRRSSLPVLEHVLIEAHRSRGVRLTATDLETAIRLTIPDARTLTAGRVLVPFKLLIGTLRGLADDAPVALATVTEGKQTLLHLSGAGMQVKLCTLPADEFPAWPGVKAPDPDGVAAPAVPTILHAETTGDTLATLAEAAPFASTEEARPILNGVLLEIHPRDHLSAAATNGHRLAYVTPHTRTPKEPDHLHSLIFPVTALECAAELSGPVNLSWQMSGGKYSAPERAWLTADGTELATRLIEGPYPHFRQIIPRDNSRTLTADRKILLGIVKRMTKMASKDTHRIALTIADGLLTVEGGQPDTGMSREEMTLTTEDNFPASFRIGFNGRYLSEILSALAGPCVRLSFYDGTNSEGRAVLITDPADPVKLIVLMPLRLVD